MLRQICRPLFRGVTTLHQGRVLQSRIIRSCSSRPNDSEQQIAKTNFQEPVWAWDEDEAKEVFGNKETEHFSFDPEKGIHQEPEDERLAFEKYVAKFGEARYYFSQKYHFITFDLQFEGLRLWSFYKPVSDQLTFGLHSISTKRFGSGCKFCASISQYNRMNR